MKPPRQISIEQVAAAATKIHSMSHADKLTLADELHHKQPNLLASCIAQSKLGVSMESVEFLLNILLVCFQAMKESRHHWPIISEDEQQRQMTRMTATAKFSKDLAHPTLTDAAHAQYLTNHPQQPLLAFVLGELKNWLQDLTHRGAETESDKFVMIAALNIVNCIAAVDDTQRA